MYLRSGRRIARENASRSIKTHLPQGIIEEILSRLPVKSLLRFRCVSKSWRSLIDSERFIKIHLQISTKDTTFSHHRMIFSIVRHSNKRELMHCSWHEFLNERAVNASTFKYLTNIQWKSIKLVGCCNGLVCFLVDRQRFFLWNPSTKMFKKLPDAFDRLHGKSISKYGFGYDESSNDYKLLVIMFCYLSIPNQVITRIFSLKNNSWKTLEDRDESSKHFGGAGKYASGNLHWNRAVGSCDWEIVSFNLKCEAYEVVERPSYSKGPQSQSLGVIDGCFSVFCSYRDSHYDIWVMKQYGVKESWVKVVTLPYDLSYSVLDNLSRLFCRGPNGEVIIFYRPGFLIYYPKHNAYHFVHRRSIGPVEEVDLYVESLVSLGSDAQQTQPISLSNAPNQLLQAIS